MARRDNHGQRASAHRRAGSAHHRDTRAREAGSAHGQQRGDPSATGDQSSWFSGPAFLPLDLRSELLPELSMEEFRKEMQETGALPLVQDRMRAPLHDKRAHCKEGRKITTRPSRCR